MTASRRTVRHAVAAATVAAVVAAAPLPAAAETAQDLFKQALDYNQGALAVETPAVKVDLLRKADSLLDRIIAEHPDSRIAEILKAGKPIGSFTRENIRERLAAAESQLSDEQLAGLGEDVEAQADSRAEPGEDASAQPAPADPAAAAPDAPEQGPQSLKTALLDTLDPAKPLDATLIETLQLIADDAPIHLGAAPRLDREGAESLTVTLSNVTMGGDGETAEVDRLSLAMTRQDDSHVAVTVEMSPEVRFDNGILRMDEPHISGVYNTELAAYSTFEAIITNLRAAEYLHGPDGPTGEKEAFRLDKASFVQTFDDTEPKLTSEATVTAEGLVVLPLGPEAEETDSFTLDRAVFTANMKDVERGGYLALVELMEMAGEDDSAVSGEQLAAVFGNMGWAGFGLEGRLEGAKVMMDGIPLAESGVVGLAFSGANAGGTGDVNLGLTVDEAGFTDAGWAKLQEAEAEARLLPRDAIFTDLGLSVTLRNVPYTRLMGAALAEREQESRAQQAVAEAGTQLVVDGLRLEAPKARIDGSGAVTSLGLAAPPAANGVLTVEGLDLLIDHVKAAKDAEHMQKEVMPILMVLKGMGKASEDGDADGLIYKLNFTVEDGFTINDMPAASLMGGR